MLQPSRSGSPSRRRRPVSSSEHGLRFHGTGVGPPGQQDRIRIAVDDNGGGPDASIVVDVGAGDFTLELWLRGTLADLPFADGFELGDLSLWSASP